MLTNELPMDKMEYEPLPEERVWYESILNGEKGWLCKREGKVYVNRGKGYTPLLFRNNEWQPVKPIRPITKQHAGRVAFEADKALLFAMGRLPESRRNWEDVKQEERMRWVHGVGPGSKAEEQRRGLYEAVMDYMEGLID